MGKRARGDNINKATSELATWNRRTYSVSHLLCLTIPDGKVVFTRKMGDLKSLPLSTVGLLNGLNMFSSSCGFKLTETRTSDARILWKDYHQSLRFILITTDDGNSLQGDHAQKILDHIFDTLVIYLGLERVTKVTNVEKLRKDLEVCSCIIDLILEQLNQDTGLIGDLIGCSDCIVSPDNSTLKNYLDEFSESMDTLFSCILVRGKIAVATQSWWMTLRPQERMLLSLCITAIAKCGANEQLIYLPQTSPMVPYRLASFQLINGIHLCMLVGHSPDLHELQQEVPKFWQDAYVHLKSLFNLQPRNFPLNWILDRNIVGFLLVDSMSMKCLVSYQPSGVSSENDGSGKKETSNGKPVITSIRKRQEILRSFYKHVTQTVWPSNLSSNGENATNFPKNFVHTCSETYLCLDHHKCYALQSKGKQLFIVCTSSIPNYALRSVCHKTMKIMTSDKQIYL